MKISKRDIAGGLYSLEEAILFLIRDEADLSYSLLLKKIQQIIITAINVELLLSRDFVDWIHDMIHDNCLYDTIARSDEITVARALSKERDKYLELLENQVSRAKLDAILSLTGGQVSFDDMIGARASLIRTYRKLRSAKIRTTPESFDYLIARITGDSDPSHLLFSVGWFTLSTALKGARRKNTARIIKKLPYRAGYLIEDVLNGTANPNIIHDEMQINSAKKSCVDAILRCYEEGIIGLEE